MAIKSTPQPVYLTYGQWCWLNGYLAAVTPPGVVNDLLDDLNRQVNEMGKR